MIQIKETSKSARKW